MARLALRDADFWSSFKVSPIQACPGSRRDADSSRTAFIPPEIMVPSRRMATLFDQARRYQQQSCVYHEDADVASLYRDHECAAVQFPNITTHILADHTDEVWRIEWSPDGLHLASAGKDRTVVIWQLEVSYRLYEGDLPADSEYRWNRKRQEEAYGRSSPCITSKTTRNRSMSWLGHQTGRSWLQARTSTCSCGMPWCVLLHLAQRPVRVR